MSERTALYDLALKAGAIFTEEAGFLVPLHYGQPESDYQKPRSTAAMFDISHHGVVEASGPDVATFLHNLCTNDVLHLPVGAGREAFFTTGQGKIVGHAIIDRLASGDGQDVFRLNVAPGTVDQLLGHLNHYLVTEQVELANHTGRLGMIHIAGPGTRSPIARLLGTNVGDLAQLEHLQTKREGGAEIFLRRHDRLGLPGYDLICPLQDAEVVWNALGGGGAQPAGMQTYHTLRVEAGTPMHGVDIDETNLPQEVGRIDQTVSFTKGCYIGQETIARIRTYGHVNRSLVGLRLEGRSVVSPWARLLREGKEVGHVTSSVWSPQVASVIGLAYLRRGNQEPGTLIDVDTEGTFRTAVVVALPFCAPVSPVNV